MKIGTPRGTDEKGTFADPLNGVVGQISIGVAGLIA